MCPLDICTTDIDMVLDRYSKSEDSRSDSERRKLGESHRFEDNRDSSMGLIVDDVFPLCSMQRFKRFTELPFLLPSLPATFLDDEFRRVYQTDCIDKTKRFRVFIQSRT